MLRSIAASAIMALAAVLGLGGCTAAARPTAIAVPPFRPAPATSSFITTFWCGPPYSLFDDTRAAEAAAAGFTIVGPPCEAAPFEPDAAKRALDVASRHGIKLWISDPRFNDRAREQADWEASVAAAVSDYSRHPAFGGYFVTDEPALGQFDDLGAIVARLRLLDPDHLAYINLLPDYVVEASGGHYREYVERFIDTVHPSLLSYDYYPFRTGRDRPTFFTNLALMRERSQQHGLPFMLILLAMPHGAYRDPSEAELSWQAFHALAYGARGISYFAYWTPSDVEFQDVLNFRHGLIEKGHPTRHYEEATTLNRRVRAIADQLATFRSVLVAESREHTTTSLSIGPVAAIENGPVTTGIFADGAGRRALLLVNRDYRLGTTVRLHLREGERNPERFDADAPAWRDDADLGLTLGSGQAVLLRWDVQTP